MAGDGLDELIHQPTRLRIMTILVRNRSLSGSELRQRLGLTPGNLGSHMARLEEAGYVRSGRLLVNLGFEVHYTLTDVGADAFRAYVDALRALVDSASVAAEVLRTRRD